MKKIIFISCLVAFSITGICSGTSESDIFNKTSRYQGKLEKMVANAKRMNQSKFNGLSRKIDIKNKRSEKIRQDQLSVDKIAISESTLGKNTLEASLRKNSKIYKNDSSLSILGSGNSGDASQESVHGDKEMLYELFRNNVVKKDGSYLSLSDPHERLVYLLGAMLSPVSIEHLILDGFLDSGRYSFPGLNDLLGTETNNVWVSTKLFGQERLSNDDMEILTDLLSDSNDTGECGLIIINQKEQDADEIFTTVFKKQGEYWQAYESRGQEEYSENMINPELLNKAEVLRKLRNIQGDLRDVQLCRQMSLTEAVRYQLDNK